MNIEVALNFKDKQIWRNWLEQNNDREKEAWLVIFKKHSKKAGLRYDDALEEALCFGWIDGKMRSIDEERFALRYSPRKAKSVWSMINKDKAELLIAKGRMTAAGLAKVEEAKKNGYWYTAYTNKIKEVIPPDLKKALMENSTAWNNFEGFANSYQNMYIGWVSGAKTDETRKKRIMEVVKRSALNKKAGIE
ncbi:YdeI family protein [Chloroflexota bacterium]